MEPQPGSGEMPVAVNSPVRQCSLSEPVPVHTSALATRLLRPSFTTLPVATSSAPCAGVMRRSEMMDAEPGRRRQPAIGQDAGLGSYRGEVGEHGGDPSLHRGPVQGVPLSHRQRHHGSTPAQLVHPDPQILSNRHSPDELPNQAGLGETRLRGTVGLFFGWQLGDNNPACPPHFEGGLWTDVVVCRSETTVTHGQRGIAEIPGDETVYRSAVGRARRTVVGTVAPLCLGSRRTGLEEPGRTRPIPPGALLLEWDGRQLEQVDRVLAKPLAEKRVPIG